MKKVIGFLIVVLFSLGAQAQNYNAKIDGIDTLTNATSQTTTIAVSGKKANVGFQVNVTKISGTVGGSIDYQGTKDGTNYETLETDSLANASGVYGFSASYNGFTKYRIVITTTGTQSSSYTVWALYRQ